MKAIRANYKAIYLKYKKIGKGKVRLTQSSLILIQLIDPKVASYTFPVLETDSTKGLILPGEIRLNVNDEFISYETGYYLGANILNVATEVGKFLLTYAPIELHSSFVGVAGAYQGTLSILVNKISRLERWDLKKHNFVPRTQFQNNSVGFPLATQPSIDFSDDGMFPMQPMLTLSGAKKNNIVIDLEAAILDTTTGDWTPPNLVPLTIQVKELHLIFRGMLAQNAAKFQ